MLDYARFLYVIFAFDSDYVVLSDVLAEIEICEQRLIILKSIVIVNGHRVRVWLHHHGLFMLHHGEVRTAEMRHPILILVMALTLLPFWIVERTEPVQYVLDPRLQVLFHVQTLRIVLVLAFGVILVLQEMVVRLVANVELHGEVRCCDRFDVVFDRV